ncbi:hypothetical protein IBX65_06475, partial [Candidatus Aerophobetes bacterium]|nr:hypothetical protein [Candidatus Aerophobetes bacterium]
MLKMRILVTFQGNYGKRIIDNICRNAPEGWEISTWKAPSSLPPIIEDFAEFLPQHLPQVNLLLCLGESTGAAELIPGLARLAKAKAVIAPADNLDWLPFGLQNQIKKELKASGVSSVFPSPFCILTEKLSEDKYIKSFATSFGKPQIILNFREGKVEKVSIKREAPCGCTRFIAEKLVGIEVARIEEKAALLHHYYPCLASGKMRGAFKDSLLHQSASMT